MKLMVQSSGALAFQGSVLRVAIIILWSFLQATHPKLCKLLGLHQTWLSTPRGGAIAVGEGDQMAEAERQVGPAEK